MSNTGCEKCDKKLQGLDPGFENTSDTVTTCICGVPGCDGFQCGHAPTPMNYGYEEAMNETCVTPPGAVIEVDDPHKILTIRSHDTLSNMEDWRLYEDHPESEVSSEHDDVFQPSHYTRFRIEPITFVMVNELPHHVGNIIKYVCRAGYKLYPGCDAIESEIKDLEKARRYAEMRINKLRGKGIL